MYRQNKLHVAHKQKINQKLTVHKAKLMLIKNYIHV